MSKVDKPKVQPKLKLVEDVSDVFGDAPIKRVDKPATISKSMTEQAVNDLFDDDLDVSAVPDISDVDVNVNKINGRGKEDKVEAMDDSVIEDTPKAKKQKGGSDKNKSAKKSSLDSSKCYPLDRNFSCR